MYWPLGYGGGFVGRNLWRIKPCEILLQRKTLLSEWECLNHIPSLTQEEFFCELFLKIRDDSCFRTTCDL